MGGIVEFSHKQIDFPYLSKSAISMYKRCKFQFYMTYIQGIEYKSNIYMDWGNYMHLIYERFFRAIDPKRVLEYALASLTGKRIRALPVYDYFYSNLLGVSDERVINTGWFFNAATGFLEFQTQRAIEIAKNFGTIEAIKRYFMPSVMEKFYRNDDLMIYGTIDSIIYDYDPEKIIINDYKNTNYIKPHIVNAPRKNGYITKLPPRYIKEGNFYVLLHATTVGGYEIRGSGKQSLIYKNDEKVKIEEEYDYSYLFLPFRSSVVTYSFARKKGSLASVRSILSLMDEIRSQTIFERCDDPNICRFCPLYEEVCKDHVPKADKVLQHIL